MATKQVKKTTTKVYQSSGPTDSVQSPMRGRSQSPARISRLQEKDQLTGLNDRLAAYIDHIRSLESENQKLHVQVQTFEETSQREISSIKDLYDKELSAARKLIDDLSKENAQLTISVGTYKSEAEEWMRKYSQRDRELSSLQKKSAEVDGQLADLETKLSQTNREAERYRDDAQRAKADVADLERQLASARKQLEDETLAKVDLENKVQSLKEELAFKSQLYQSELNETRTRMEYTMEEVDSRTQHELESRLRDALADLRKQHEEQTHIHREELEMLYESKIAGLQKELESQDGHDEKTRVEISSYRSRISELQSQINKLTNQNANLESRVASLEADLAAERDQSKLMAEVKDREIRLLREQMDDQMKEYQDLLDIKISLDLEIAAYRKLLEGEEERLNLSQSFSQSAVKSTPRKRRRADDDQQIFIEDTKSNAAFTSSGKSFGSIEVQEVDQEGKFVKLRNTSTEEVSIGGWKLAQKAGDNETEYKFHRSTKLGSGDVATVWSSDSNVTHDVATHNLVMKGLKWVVGDAIATTLTDKDGKEQATQELSKTVQRTILKASRHGGKIDDQTSSESAKCSIM